MQWKLNCLESLVVASAKAQMYSLPRLMAISNSWTKEFYCREEIGEGLGKLKPRWIQRESADILNSISELAGLA